MGLMFIVSQQGISTVQDYNRTLERPYHNLYRKRLLPYVDIHVLRKISVIDIRHPITDTR